MKHFLIVALIVLAQTLSPVLVKLHAQQLDLQWTKGNLAASRVAPGINGQCLTTVNGVSAWASCAAGGGSGTVTSFSSGNLAPLFSTSVSTATTTPSLAFTLTNAAAHSFFGNNTGISAAPAFIQPASTDLADFSTTAATSAGQIPIFDGSKYVPGDPLVQGLFADGSTSVANPVIIGGYDTQVTPAQHRAIFLNAAPAGTEYGIVTRNIPSGTQPVSGSVSVSNFPATQPVSGTITANAGSGTFAVSAASLPLPTGAATSARQPALGTAGTPSVDVITVQGATGMTAVKVDGSAVTQPVSGTVTANAGSGTFAVGGTVTANAGTGTFTNQQTSITADYDTGAGTQNLTMFGVALPASGGAVAGGTAANPLQVSLANTGANATAVKVDGSAVTQPVSGTVTVTQSAASNLKVDLSGTAANATAIKVDGSAVTQPVSATGLTDLDGAIVADGAPTAVNDIQIGGNGSGNLKAFNNCDGYAFYDAATNGATQLVALVSGKTIYVCGYSFTSSSTTANTLKLVYGTGANCATGQTAMTPGVILQAAASSGPAGKVIPPTGMVTGLKTAASNALCALTNAAAAAQVEVWYTQR